jgi:hypothetical protein
VSAQETKQAPVNPQRQRHGHGTPKPENQDKHLSALMKRMGAPRFDPVPPDQYEWQRDADAPPIFRMWSCMIHCTCAFGHRSEYAVSKDGSEMHMEHLAEMLDMDLANAYRTWNQGVKRGLWRTGKLEGNAKRLYLCGKVEKQAEEQDPRLYRNIALGNLPSYLRSAIKEWPQETQDAFMRRWEREFAIKQDAQADIIAALRRLIADREDALFREFDLASRRQNHSDHKGRTPEEVAARAQRIEAILPGLQNFVQTISNSVQTVQGVVYKVDKTVANEVTPYSLEKGAAAAEKSEKSDTVVASDISTARPQPQHSPEGKKSGYLPEPKQANSGPAKAGKYPDRDAALSAFSQHPEAAQMFCFELPRMQKAYEHSDFGLNDFDAERTTDQILVGRLILITGAQHNIERAMRYVVFVAGKFKGLDRNALGKEAARAPGTPNGPRYFGLLLEWALDWRAKNPEVIS